MDDRVEKLRTAKEAETLEANATRLGRPDLAEQARLRGQELRIAERKSRHEQGGQPKPPRTRVSPRAKPALPDESLFLNGVFESVLQEIEIAQTGDPEIVCYLQPYKPALIRRLQESPPTKSSPWRLFMSVTSSLPMISYEAEVVEWHDKRAMASEDLERINASFARHQPNEKRVHMAVDGQEEGWNLLGIIRLTRLDPPLAVEGFQKLSDNEPLAERTRAGGWSYVRAPKIREPYEVIGEEEWTKFTKGDAKRAGKSTREERLQRLVTSDPVPTAIYVKVKMFRRSQDVINEVLFRADGHCEGCLGKAPFVRASDGTPFLEVHHRVRLADGGHDTVENALALCPNCHRKHHFGRIDQIEELEEAVGLA